MRCTVAARSTRPRPSSRSGTAIIGGVSASATPWTTFGSAATSCPCFFVKGACTIGSTGADVNLRLASTASMTCRVALFQPSEGSMMSKLNTQS